jgi:predicted flap endonuclease-1-like 5' DNA nuclease
MCWKIAAAVGALAVILLWLIGASSLLWALLIGIILAVLLGVGLRMVLCKGDADPLTADAPDPSEGRTAAIEPTDPARPAEHVAERTSDLPPEARSAAATAGAAPASGMADVPAEEPPQPQAAPGVDEPPRVTDADVLQDPAAAPAPRAAELSPEPSAVDAMPGREAEDLPAGDTPRPHPNPADPASSVEAVPEAGGPGQKPETLSTPRASGADDLTQIRGIGPKLAGVLHEMGVYHFDQIASWSDAEVAWVDANLKGFRGRVSRDDWVTQAKALRDQGQGA